MWFTVDGNKLDESNCRAHMLTFLRQSMMKQLPKHILFTWAANSQPEVLPETITNIEELTPVHTILDVTIGEGVTTATINPDILPYGWAIMGLIIGYLRDCGEVNDTMKRDLRSLNLEKWLSNEWSTDLETTWYYKSKVNDHVASFDSIFPAIKNPQRKTDGSWSIVMSWLKEENPIYAFMLEEYTSRVDAKWLEEPPHELFFRHSSGGAFGPRTIVLYCPHCDKKTWATEKREYKRYMEWVTFGATTFCCGVFLKKKDWTG